MGQSSITIGTDWSDRFIETVASMNGETGARNGIVVREVYGSLPGDQFGSARSRDRLHGCDLDLLRHHTEICHQLGIKVAYANNALCMGSTNDLDAKLDGFLSHIGSLVDAGIDSVILTFPLLIEQVKQRFPELGVIVSTIAHVDSVKSAGYYAEMGANRIVLPVDTNRDFRLLTNLIDNVPIEFELLMTDACVYDCPFRQNHFATQSHDSVEGRKSFKHTEVSQYPFDRCWPKISSDWPAEFLKSRWIRPEDVEEYENIGFSWFKISGRTMKREWIAKSLSAYLSRQWDGNLLEIFPIIPGNYQREGESPLSLPNRKLDGFLAYFIAKGSDCRTGCGVDCSYCDQYAERISSDKNG